MSKDYTDVLLEEMNSKFDLLLEAIAPLKQMQQDIFTTKEDVAELKADVKVIKAVVTDLSHQVNRHEKEIAELKTA